MLASRRFLLTRNCSRLFCSQNKPDHKDTEDSSKKTTAQEGTFIEFPKELNDPEKTKFQRLKAFAMKFAYEMFESAKLTFAESKVLYRMIREKGLDHKNYSVAEIRDRRRMMKDIVFKAIPYGIIVALPFTPLLMAIYLSLFPNSIPSQFMNLETIKKKHLAWRIMQQDGKDELMSLLEAQKIVFKGIKSEDRLKHWEEDSETRHAYDTAVDEFASHADLEHQLDSVRLNKLSSHVLEKLCQVFVYEYIPGYRLTNIFFGMFFRSPFYFARWVARKRGSTNLGRFTDNVFFRTHFTLDSGPLKFYKKWLLKHQLTNHFKHIRIQDQILAKNPHQIDSLDHENLVHFAQQRGVIITDEKQIKQYLFEHWLPLSTRPDISNTTLMWVALLRMNSVKYLN